MTAAHRPFRHATSAAALLALLVAGASLLADSGAPVRGMNPFDEPPSTARESVPRVGSPFYQAADNLRAPDDAAGLGGRSAAPLSGTPPDASAAGFAGRPGAPSGGAASALRDPDLFGPAGSRAIPPPSTPAQSSNRPIGLTIDGGSSRELPGRSTVATGSETPPPVQTEPEGLKQAAADYDSLTAPDRPAAPRSRKVVEPIPDPPTATGWGTSMNAVVLIVGLGLAGWAAAWGIRRQTLPPRTGGTASLVEHVESRTLAPQTTLHVVRVGTRLLILGHTPQGLQTLSEIDDPERVSQLMSLSETSQGLPRGPSFRGRSAPAAEEPAGARSRLESPA